jgi:hypothetical protein
VRERFLPSFVLAHAIQQAILGDLPATAVALRASAVARDGHTFLLVGSTVATSNAVPDWWHEVLLVERLVAAGWTAVVSAECAVVDSTGQRVCVQAYPRPLGLHHRIPVGVSIAPDPPHFTRLVPVSVFGRVARPGDVNQVVGVLVCHPVNGDRSAATSVSAATLFREVVPALVAPADRRAAFHRLASLVEPLAGFDIRIGIDDLGGAVEHIAGVAETLK